MIMINQKCFVAKAPSLPLCKLPCFTLWAEIEITGEIGDCYFNY